MGRHQHQRNEVFLTPLIGAGLALVLLAGACGRGGVDADSARVDIAKPTFSNPTSITNPLFPVSELAQVIQLGEDGGKALRVEVTLLPGAKTIDWNGQQVDTVVSQFVAYLDGHIVEGAVDYFAQADDGAVWYFGEDVDNYKGGVLVDHDGTWLAGRDGRPGMIMPGRPKVGDVYRPENIPGLVFEEVTVQAINEWVDGPRGRVKGAVLTKERLMEGTTEEKAWAPGYGEFQARAKDELVTVALAVPTDALPTPPPAGLDTLLAGADKIFDTAPSQDWEGISATLWSMTAAWKDLRRGQTPPLLETQMTDALDGLARAIKAQKPASARRAALEVSEATLDLKLRHLTPAEIDLARLDLWARRLLVSSAAADTGVVAGNVAALEWIWKRVRHAVDASNAQQIDAQLAKLRAAADKKDLAAAANAIPALRETLTGTAAKTQT